MLNVPLTTFCFPDEHKGISLSNCFEALKIKVLRRILGNGLVEA